MSMGQERCVLLNYQEGCGLTFKVAEDHLVNWLSNSLADAWEDA